MDDGRRLPTGILVLLAVVLLGLGTAWWVTAAPERSVAPARAADPPAGSILLLRLDDGRVLPYQKGWPGPVQWISDTYFPCGNIRRQPLSDVPGARFAPCARHAPAAGIPPP